MVSANSRNTLFNKTSVFLTRAQVTYIRGLELGIICDQSKRSSDRVIDYLTEQGHDFIYLCHRDVLKACMKDSSGDSPSLASNKATTLYCGLSCGSSDKMLEHSIPKHKEQEMLEYAKSHRRAYMLRANQNLFMGVVSVIKEERCALDLCP